MERIPTNSPEADIPQEAGPLADWIEEELGDEELAQFLRDHPEGLELCANGESLLPRTMFELVEDLGKVNIPEALALVRRVEEDGALIEVSGEQMVGNMKGEGRELRQLKRLWEGSKRRLSLEAGEYEKTPLDLAMIEQANVAIDSLREKYGLEPFQVPPEAVRFVDDIPKEGPDVFGTFAQYPQEAHALYEIHPVQKLELTIHEMAHFKSYGAIMVNKDGEGRLLETTYRTGMNIYSRDGKKKYLTGLNEAVTEETANRLLLDVPDDHPTLGDLAKEHRRMVSKIATQNESQLAKDRIRPHWFIPTEKVNDRGMRHYIYSYTKERNVMEDLFEKLFDRNPERFEGKTKEEANEELFTMLQKAMFTGNILPFGRLFNDTFGRGKFREYGHLQSVEEQQAFIAAL